MQLVGGESIPAASPEHPSTGCDASRLPPPTCEEANPHLEVDSCVGPDTILSWPILDYASDSISYNASALVPRSDSLPSSFDNSSAVPHMSGMLFADQNTLKSLVRRFLQHVHSKNPMMDVEQVARLIPALADEPPGQDVDSCLLVSFISGCRCFNLRSTNTSQLLICALALLASESLGRSTNSLANTSLHFPGTENTRAAERLHSAALQRLAPLQFGLKAAYCWHYSGVYQMYRLDPARAWPCFTQASLIALMLLKSRDGQYSNEEVSLYWTCWKSEMYNLSILMVPNTKTDQTTGT